MAKKQKPSCTLETLWETIRPESVFFCLPLLDEPAQFLVEVMEELEANFTDARIGWYNKISFKDHVVEGHFIEDVIYSNVDAMESRTDFIMKAIKRDPFPTFWNGDAEHPISITLKINYGHIPGRGSAPLSYTIVLTFKYGLLDRDLLIRSFAIREQIRYAYLQDMEGFSLSTLEFALERSELGRWADNEINIEKYRRISEALQPRLPHLIGKPTKKDALLWRIYWKNYWSPQIAAVYGFPDPILDARILPLAEQLPNGGWLFRLTEEPLDLLRPDHQEMIVWAYQRFRPVGCPVEKKA